ncbi:MAG: DNA recombination protein RmuC, partial [Planctomycetota bacterium]
RQATGQVVELSQGVRDLNVLLKTPTGRGTFGEMTLEQMLGDLLGEYTGLFERQHTREGGERVDAAIFVKPDRTQCLCVDAKFPLANALPLVEGKGTAEHEKAFRKDVVDRAKEIQTRYIKPPETLDLAFMFIPSEAVYYLVLRDEKLHQDLLRRRVMPTSPNGFYAYLRVLSVAFQGMKIEEKAREIQKAIEKIGKEFDRFADWFRKLDGHLRKARSAYDESSHRLDRFRDRIDMIKQGEVPPPSRPEPAEAAPPPEE